mgnify:CR=1 FL=1
MATRPRGATPVTIKDIAKAADVSHATVSRALNDHPALSEATIAKVKRLAAKMGYVPNASARGLKTRRSQALGVIVSHIDDPFWSEVLQGIDEVLRSAGYSLFVAATQRDEQREKQIVQTMVQRGVEGVILCAPQFSTEQNSSLQSYGLATVVVNNEGASAARYLVFNDDRHGIELLTKHLLDQGHRRIAYLGNAVGGRMADRFGPDRTLILLAATQVALTPLITLVPFGLAGGMALAFLWSVCGWSFMAPQQMRLVTVDPQTQGVMLALNAASIYLGSAIGSTIGGFVYANWSLAATGPAAAVLCALALAQLLFSIAMTKRRKAAA